MGQMKPSPPSTPGGGLKLAAVRRALADYMSSEGCSCCQGGDHDQHKEALAKLLRVPKYADGSGYNFYKYKTKEKK